MTVEQITKKTRLYTFETEPDEKRSKEFTTFDQMYIQKRLEQLDTIVNLRLIIKWCVSYYLIDKDTEETVLIERRIYKTRNAAANQFRKY